MTTEAQERGWAFVQRLNDKAKWRRPPKAQVMQVIEVVFLRGEGVEGDPVREVTAYYAMDGTVLAERDDGLEVDS